MVVGALFNSTWVLQSIIPAEKFYHPNSDYWAYSENFYYAVNIVISAASGFMGSILWVAEEDENQVINISENHRSELSNTGVEISQQNKKRGFCKDVERVYKLLISKRMLIFLPQLLWIGVSIAIYSGLLVTIIQTSLTDVTNINKKNEKSMLALVAFGVGEIVGAMIIGQIVDRMNSTIASFFNVLFIAITTVLTIIFLIYQEYNWFTFVMAFMWGLEDGSVNTHALEMLGFEFDDNTDPFAIFSMFEAFAVFIFQIIQSRLDDRNKFFIYIGVVGGLGCLMCGSTYFFDFKEKRAKQQGKIQQIDQ
eukprot:403333605